MEADGIFILGAFLFACILVSEHRRGGEPPRERRAYRSEVDPRWSEAFPREYRRSTYRRERGERWRAWIHGGKGRESNINIQAIAWIGLVIMCLFAWQAFTFRTFEEWSRDCRLEGGVVSPKSGLEEPPAPSSSLYCWHFNPETGQME